MKERKIGSADGFSGTHNKPLQDFEYILSRDSLIRCHRSFIANVNHIKDIHPDLYSIFVLAIDSGDQIPVSQSYASYFRKLL